MTRKHFTAIALMLNRQFENATTQAEAELIASITRNLAAQFSQINRNFNFARFYTAVGLAPNGYLPVVTPEMVQRALKSVTR